MGPPSVLLRDQASLAPVRAQIAQDLRGSSVFIYYENKHKAEKVSKVGYLLMKEECPG